MKVGFIGLGTMGIGMASNLRKAGYDLVVYDVRKESAQPLLEAGATWVETVADLGRAADVVFTSLPGPKEMQEVGLGKGGLLESMRKGSTWFDLTTNSPTVLREVSKRFQEKGIALLDAPVSGGPAGAQSGKLAIYVGGDRDVFDRHKKLLDAIGDQVLHVGPVGAGNTAKLVHNCGSLVIRMAIAEVFTLGVKAGMDPLELWHAVRQGVIGRRRTFDGIGDQYLQYKVRAAQFRPAPCVQGLHARARARAAARRTDEARGNRLPGLTPRRSSAAGAIATRARRCSCRTSAPG